MYQYQSLIFFDFHKNYLYPRALFFLICSMLMTNIPYIFSYLVFVTDMGTGEDVTILPTLQNTLLNSKLERIHLSSLSNLGQLSLVQ